MMRILLVPHTWQKHAIFLPTIATVAENFLGLIIFKTSHKHPATQQTFDIADGTECSGFGYNLCDWSEAKLIVMSTFRVPPIT